MRTSVNEVPTEHPQSHFHYSVYSQDKLRTVELWRCNLTYWIITQCYLSPDTSEHTPPYSQSCTRLTYLFGR